MADTPKDFTPDDGVVANDSEVPTVETEVVPTPATSKRPWGAIAVAGAVTAAVVVGGVVLSGGGADSDRTETSPAVEQSEDADADADDAETTSEDGTATEQAGSAEVAATEEEAMAEEVMAEEVMADSDVAMDAIESAVDYGGISSAVFDGERFVSLAMNEAGWSVRTSVDGLDWSEATASGLPSEGYVTWLDVQDGTLVALVDSYSETDGQTVFLARSQDGTTWSTTALPAGGENTGFNGAALTNDGVMVLLSRYEESFADEIGLLVDLGVIDAGSEETYCGFDQLEPGGEITVYICNYEEYDEFVDDDFQEPSDEEIAALAEAFDAATTDEERDAIQAQLEELWGEPYAGEESTVAIAPGEPGFSELVAIREAQSSVSIPLLTLTGPLEGPLTVVDEFDAAGYTSGLAATSAGHFIAVDSYTEASGSSTKIMSWNGDSWVGVGSLGEGVSGHLYSAGDSLLFTGFTDVGGENLWSSTDGVSWTPLNFGTADRGGYTQVVSGNAGAVAVTMIYDGPEYDRPNQDILTIEKDGFVLEIETITGNATLTTDAGVLVHDLDSTWEPSPDSDVARLNPISGDITFLDPDTGEDLVVITSDDFEAAFGYDDIVTDFVEPIPEMQVRTTTDGVTWNLIEVPEVQNLTLNTSVYPLVVGNDAAIMVLETYSEPPVELFAFEEQGREPTDAEIEAIELYDSSAYEITYIRVELN